MYLFLLIFTIVPIYFVICLIIFVIFGSQCGTFATTLNRYIFIVISAISLISTAICILWDMIQNRHLICKCKLKEYFITNDPYQFRSAFISSPLLLVALFIWAIPFSYPSMIRIIFSEMGYVIGFWIISVHPLIITIYRIIRNKKPSDKIRIEAIFEIPELYDIFLEFAKNEWSIENVYCKKLILDYKKSGLEKRKEIIKKIKEQFLDLNSQFELNITEVLRENLLKKIELLGNLLTLNDSYDIFKELDDEIVLNLNDIYMRFQFSYSYQIYQKKFEILEKEKAKL